MKTVFSKVKIFPVAIASKDEIYSVVPIGFASLCIMNQFGLKTISWSNT
jgi:hypothetical protein